MNKLRVVLASKSPRRKELLGNIFDEFEIITKDTDESFPEDTHPSRAVEFLAVRKGEAVAELLPSDTLIISSDTLVELDGIPLGKPSSKEDAVRILMTLSGKAHNVHTGVAVHYKGQVFSGVDTARVIFKDFAESEAWDYVKTGEPMDKAGAYAIQGIGARLVSKYEGEFNTIVGLSLKLTKKLVDMAENYDKA